MKLLDKYLTLGIKSNRMQQRVGDYIIARSIPDNRFAIFVHKDTWKLLKNDTGMTETDLCVLPELVHSTCKTLGLLRQTPEQFFLEFCHTAHQTNAPMAISQTSPADVSKELGAGKIIERSILIYQESFLEELQLKDKKNGRDLQARRLYTRISLAHEMAHLFTTDEFHGPFNGMGYARLERLTDAIAFQVFSSELLNTPAELRPQFVKCFPYIMRFIQAVMKQRIEGDDLVNLAQNIAAEMVREGQMFNGAARPSKTGLTLGAPSLE